MPQRPPVSWRSSRRPPRFHFYGFEKTLLSGRNFLLKAFVSLFVVKQEAKAAARKFPQRAERGEGQVLREGRLGSRFIPGGMRLVRWVPSHHRTSLGWLGLAHRASHGQYSLLREFSGAHIFSVDHRTF
jgi:hypothetical protein